MPGPIASMRPPVVRTARRWWAPTPPRSEAGPCCWWSHSWACRGALCCVVLCYGVLCCVVLCCVVLCCVVLCCVVLCCVVLCCVVLRCVVLCCVVLCCVVLCCVVLCCAAGPVTRRQWPGCLPTGTGKREGVCLSARCVLVCCCTAGSSARSHLAGTAQPTPVHGHTRSSGPTALCVMCCTISILCAVPHCLVLCSALHCVCLAALHLWVVGSG